MSIKFSLGNLFHRAPPTLESAAEEHTQEAEKLKRELGAAELETRFREALANGEITGDIITLDKDGKAVKNTKSTNIFDL
jgi:hypothetical protein